MISNSDRISDSHNNPGGYNPNDYDASPFWFGLALALLTWLVITLCTEYF